MTDVADLVRELRADLPEPDLGAPADTARIARARAGGRASPSRRRIRRLAAMTAGGMATAGLAAVLVYLFVVAPDGPSRVSGARVDWGMTAAVRVEPDPGVSVADATAQAVQAIRARGRAQDIAGLVVGRIGNGRLGLTVPAATRERQIAGLVTFTDFAIYDEAAVVARAGSFTILRRLIAANVPPGTPIAGYVVGSAGSWFPQLFPTRRAAEKAGRETGRHDSEVLGIPRGYSLVYEQLPGRARILLVQGAPVLRRGDIAGIRLDRGRLVFDLRPEARKRLERTHSRSGSGSGGRKYIVVDRFPVLGDRRPQALTPLIGRSAPGRGTDQGIVVDPGSEDASAQYGRSLGGLVVGGRLVVESSDRYGELPSVIGDAVEPPADVKRASQGKPIVRVLAGNAGGREVALWVYRVGPGSSYIIEGGSNGLSGGSPCDMALGAAALASCGGELGEDHFLLVGRAGPEVATVEATTSSGETVRGIVRNSWFVAAKASSGPPTAPPKALPLPPQIRPPLIVARNAEGKVVGRIEE